MLAYRRIGVTVKSGLDGKDRAVERVLAILNAAGADICVDRKRTTGIHCTRPLKAMAGKHIDLLLVIGGDGTILRAIRELNDLSIPILSVNRGAIGFLAETSVDEAEELLPKLLAGGGIIEERTLLTVDVLRKGRKSFHGLALNEAVLSQGAIARLLDLHTTVAGEPLTTFHADGLIIATPTGSTAYSLAAGGPIVHPRLSPIILTPINPHSFSQKPIVLPGDQTIDVDVLKKRAKSIDCDVGLTLDGQVYFPLRGFDRVRVSTHPKSVKFLRRRQDTFLSTLRTKLRWGE